MLGYVGAVAGCHFGLGVRTQAPQVEGLDPTTWRSKGTDDEEGSAEGFGLVPSSWYIGTIGAVWTYGGGAVMGTVARRRRHPTVLLLLLGAVAFLSVFDGIAVVSNVPLLRNPAGVFGLALAGLYFFHRKVIAVSHGGVLLGVAFFVVASLAVAVSSLLSGRAEPFIYLAWVQVFVLFLITADLAKDHRALVYVGGGFVAAMVVAAGLLVWEVGGVGGANVRASFGEANANRQAYWFALGVIIVLWGILRRLPRFGWSGVLAVAAAIVLFSGVLITGSRGGFLSMVVGLAFLFLLTPNRRNALGYVLALATVVIIGGALLLEADVLLRRLELTTTGAQYGARDQISAAAFRLVLQQPVIGYGFGREAGQAIGAAMGRGSESAPATHNTYLQVAIAFGVPALSLWLLMLVSVMARSWKARRDSVALLFLCLLITSMAYGLVSDLGLNKYFWLLLGFAAGTTYPSGSTSAPTMLDHRSAKSYEHSLLEGSRVAGGRQAL